MSNSGIGRSRPRVSQAEISGVCKMDALEHRERMRPNTNARIKGRSFGGSHEPANFKFSAGEIILGRKKNRDINGRRGGNMESGMPSWNGFAIKTYPSEETAMSEFYFIGYAKSEGSNSGVPVLKAGSITTINEGTDIIYSGDLLVWAAPILGRPRGQSPTSKRTTVLRKYNADYVPGAQLAHVAAFIAEDHANAGRGTKGLPLTRLSAVGNATPGATPLSLRQREALSYEAGILGIVLRGIKELAGTDAGRDLLHDLSNDGGVGAHTDSVMHARLNTFLSTTWGGNGNDDAVRIAFVQGLLDIGGDINDVNATAEFKSLMKDPVGLLVSGMGATAKARRERVCAVAMSNAMPGQPLDIMVGIGLK